MKKIVILLIFTCFLLVPVFVFATDFGAGNLKTAVGGHYSGKEDLGTSLGNVIGAVLALAGTIFLILTVYGGITWMIAMGNSEKVEKAKNILVAAVIGGAITAGAYAITYFVFSRIAVSGGSSTGSSGAICVCFDGDETNCREVNSRAECVGENEELAGTCGYQPIGSCDDYQ